MLPGIASVLIGYLMGSVPAPYLVARLSKQVDIRRVGVGNMGAANVFREIGLVEGAVAAVADVAKGAAVVLVAWSLGVAQPWVLGAGFAALLGHNFPVYIGFRGGKGAATTIGVFLVLAPQAMAITLGVLVLVYLFVRRIFFALCLSVPFLPLLIWQLEESAVLALYALAFVIFMAARNLSGAGELWADLSRMKKGKTAG